MNKLLFLIFLPIFCFGELTGPHYFNDSDGNTREYYLYVPNDLPEDAPLVYSLHGWGASGLSMSSYGSFNNLAETYKFLVCYPTALIDGDGGSSGWTSWNTNGTSDVDFIIALNEELINEYQVDENKVFSTGFSYGAEMSHHLARCQTTSVFAAIAPVSGAIFDYMDICSPSVKTSVFILHGTTDNIVYYDGGDFEGYGPYMSAPDAVANWVEFNSCVFTESDIIPNADTWTSGPINTEKYINEIDNTSVWFYSIINLGHSWPTINNSEIDASEEIWNFFMYVINQNNISSIHEQNSSKVILKNTDILGRETINKGLHLEIYNDGSVEKKYILK